MEANYQGLRLFNRLCGEKNSYLKKENHSWIIKNFIDISSYITPELDESYNPNYYRPSFWRMVKPNLKKHCNQEKLSELQRIKKDYSKFKKKSFSFHYLEKKVKEKKLKGGKNFSLESVCLEKQD